MPTQDKRAADARPMHGGSRLQDDVQPIGSAGAPDAPSREAFETFAAEFRSLLLRFIRQQVRNEADAEDMAQQTLLIAASNLDSFRGDSKFSTWMLGIASNLIRNHRKRAPQHRYVFDSEDVLADLEASTPMPDQWLQLNRSLRRLDTAVRSLPRQQAEALILVAVDECSYEEAATTLDVAVGTVRSRVSRAREALRRRHPLTTHEPLPELGHGC